MEDPRTLLLVDDHPLFHEGLASMLRTLEPERRLLSAFDATQGVAMARAEPAIDLILIDIQLPDIDGFEALALFGQACPFVPRLLISGREDAVARSRAQRGGASGFISKAWPAARIVEMIDLVMEGGSGFDAAAGSPPSPAPQLTARQMEVLALLSEGRSNKDIEFRLGIAQRTVRAHLTELFHALGAQTRVQALLKAQKLGMIP